MLDLLVTKINHPIILGLPWFKYHNPAVNWKDSTLSFTSCPNSCRPEKSSAIHLLPSSSIPVDSVPSVVLQTEIVSPQSLPPEYTEFSSVFASPSSTPGLPPPRPFDLEIHLRDPNVTPPFRPLYNLSKPEQSTLKEWVDDQLQRGLIRASKSPAGAPVFFVKKKDGGLRPCIDYRGLNSNTVKDRFPLPLISQILDKLSGARYFTTLDLQGAYNLLRIREGHEWKAAFRTPYGLYEPLVIPFGLCNAPSVFQRFINSIFSDLLDISVIIYLDDILVYSRTLAQHHEDVKKVLKRLQDNQLFAKLSKCSFNQSSVSFLGYVISDEGVTMCPSKVESIKEWPIPNSVTAVQSFLGFCNFYRRFIPHFSTVAQPLTELTKKSKVFTWSPSCQAAFEKLKEAASSEAVVLPHPDFDKPFILETDASDFGIGAVLLQEDVGGKPRPLSFYSRKFNSAETNYTVHDKELLAIIVSLKHFRHYLQGSTFPFTIISDHKNLLFFNKPQHLKPRHARWAEVLSQFDFNLEYKPGKLNQVADSLSRREPPLEKEDSSQNLKSNKPKGKQLTLLPEHRWVAVNVNETNADTTWPEHIAHYLEFNEWPEGIDSESLVDEVRNFEIKNSHLYRIDGTNKALYLPLNQRTNTLRRFHEGLGHLAPGSTLTLLTRRYWWPNMEKDLKNHCNCCAPCQLNKRNSSALREQVRPPLRPIPPVALPFERWGIDFIQNLPLTKNGNRHIITAIDYATRWVVAKAVQDMTTNTVVQFLYENIVMNYGCPFEIISDRGSSFLSEAVQSYEDLLNIRHLASSPYHPQTNGMVERMHAMVNQALTTLSDGKPQRWDEFIHQTIFSIRIREHAVTNHSPFYLLYGVEPRIPGDTDPPHDFMIPLDELERKEANLEFTIRELEDLGHHRAAAYIKSLAQAEKMKQRNEGNQDAPEHYFEIGDMVKMKHHTRTKFEFRWKGPYHIVELGPPGTYRLMDPRGRQLDSLINQRDLAPWLSPTRDNEDYFYDGTNRADTPPEPLNTRYTIPNSAQNPE